MSPVHQPPASRLPPVRRIIPAPGAQLPAEEIFGRGDDVSAALRLLEKGSVLLNEPRRIGKSSLLTLLQANLPAGWRCVRQSFQGMSSTAVMAASVIAAIADQRSLGARARDVARQFLSSVEFSAGPVSVRLNAAVAEDPSAALADALTAVNDRMGHDERLLFLWDEVPDMLHDLAAEHSLTDARGLMATLRRLRDEPSRCKLRWLMTGSVGFHHILKRLDGGASLVNDMVSLPLGPLDEAWSAWLCEGLLQGIDAAYDQEAVRALAEITGGIPYLAHLAAKQARDERLRSLSAESVEGLFDRAIADPDQGRPTTHQLSRLGPYYGEWREAAEAILTELVDRPATRAALGALSMRVRHFPDGQQLREVLAALCDDHYLEKDQTGTYRWRHAPLARAWYVQTN